MRAIVTPPSPDLSATVVPTGKDGWYWRVNILKIQEIQEVTKRKEDEQNRLAEALLDLLVSTTTLRYTSVAH
jgi:hypothetical protein